MHATSTYQKVLFYFKFYDNTTSQGLVAYIKKKLPRSIVSKLTVSTLLPQVDLTKLCTLTVSFLKIGWDAIIIYGETAQVQLGLLLVTDHWQNLHV